MSKRKDKLVKRKGFTGTDYEMQLIQDSIGKEGRSEKLKEYDDYLKEHQKRLRRLEREQRGEPIPGDYYGDE